MPPTPPIGAPLAAVAPMPTTRHQAVPIDAREWRIRTEQRANGILLIAIALLTATYLTPYPWLAIVALTLGLAGLVVSFVLRPALPFRSPAPRRIDEADLAVMGTGTAAFPAVYAPVPGPQQPWPTPMPPLRPATRQPVGRAR